MTHVNVLVVHHGLCQLSVVRDVSLIILHSDLRPLQIYVCIVCGE